MHLNPVKNVLGLKRVLDLLIAAKKITETQRDTTTLSEYKEILQEHRHELMQFDRSSDSLEKFFMTS